MNVNGDKNGFRRALLKWYTANARDLPWRRTSDPYSILVSELMLQQTQVKTVLPYYAKFLKTFPTAAKLAKAPEEQVLHAWAGLGYYRRARFLQAAAKAIVAGKRFPETLEGIRALPGVGEYTAAAVGSIAFGLPAAVVDGNVIRVMSRLIAMDGDPTKGAGAQKIKDTAQALLDPKRPGDFNQAVMELGASLCSPTKPACPLCPLQPHCSAFLAGKPEAYPQLPARAAAKELVKAVLIFVQGKGAKTAVLMKRREESKAAQVQGFWTFPEAEIASDDVDAAELAARAEAKKLFGKAALLAGRLPKHKHGITNHAISLWPFWFNAVGEPKKKGWEWTTLAKLEKLPLASAEKKMLVGLRAALAPEATVQGQLGLKL